MDLAQFFKPCGRMRRTHYFAIGFVFNVVFTLGELSGNLLIQLGTLILLWPALMLGIQRAHDMDMDWKLPLAVFGLALFAGAFQELGGDLETAGNLMSILMFGLGIWLLIGKPTEGENQYGPDPRDIEAVDAPAYHD